MNLRALLLWMLLALTVVGGTAAGVLRCEGSPPELAADGPVLIGRAGARVALRAADAESGLRRLEVLLVHARGEAVLADRRFDGDLLRGGLTRGPEELVLALDPEALDLREGSAKLLIRARDWSWRGRLSGNAAALELPVEIDLTPPRIRVESGLTYVRRGGAAAVSYRVSEPSTIHGVEVGETFFAGAPAPDAGGDAAGAAAGERYVAIFAVPSDAPRGPRIQVVATDAVGNRSSAGFSARVQERSFPEVRISLPPAFLESKVPELAAAHDIKTADAIAAFAAINTELRARNEAALRELLPGAPGERLFEGAFEQLRGSVVTSRFAERRAYFANGARISEATHFGYDLASTAGAPVGASNHGRVLFAGELGIYGSCVVIDHGLGVRTLYGHLSRVDVAEGDGVERGQTIGLTGDTGLAGGDHLHFGILVGETYVDPIEWWDPKWVREHILVRLEPPE